MFVLAITSLPGHNSGAGSAGQQRQILFVSDSQSRFHCLIRVEFEKVLVHNVHRSRSLTLCAKDTNVERPRRILRKLWPEIRLFFLSLNSVTHCDTLVNRRAFDGASRPHFWQALQSFSSWHVGGALRNGRQNLARFHTLSYGSTLTTPFAYEAGCVQICGGGEILRCYRRNTSHRG